MHCMVGKRCTDKTCQAQKYRYKIFLISTYRYENPSASPVSPAPPSPQAVVSQKCAEKLEKEILGYESELPDDPDTSSSRLYEPSKIVRI